MKSNTVQDYWYVPKGEKICEQLFDNM